MVKPLEKVKIVSSSTISKDVAGSIKDSLDDKFIVDFETDSSAFKNKIEVTSAFELDKDLKDKIKGKFGKEMEYSFVIKPEVIGGVRIRTENELFDGTIKAKLQNLKSTLIS